MTYNLAMPSVLDSTRFPPDFQWGAATSAAQIEGAARQDGKGVSIWDTFCTQSGRIKDGTNIDIACDHYHRFEQDIELMQWMGLDAYRFSISWPRVQANGRGSWNDVGFDFYERLIDRLLRADIKPHVTLYHWDLPQTLQDAMAGWQSRDVASLFAVYANEVARRFGDRVVSIATINEPWCVATLGHETAQFAPGIKSRRIAAQVSHHLLLAHGLAMQAIRTQTSAQLGIVLNHTPAYPAEATESNRLAARLADGKDVRWYMDPLFRGCYPSDILEHLGDDAPVIQPGDFAIIRAPMDFLGINFYTRNFISDQTPVTRAPGALGFTDMGWEVFPDALTQHLVRITREYAPPPLFITENGMANADVLINGRVADTPRVDYLRWHLDALAKAIALGADVRGYFYWSLLDNFEWDSGYTKRFGLIHVDFDTQERVLKDSAHWYRNFIREHTAVNSGV